MVVIYHTSVIFRVPTYWGATPFGDVPKFLDSGVDFFFVLSGFIILDAHLRDIGSPARFANYIWRRAVRIYPLYWVIFCAVLAPLLLARADVDLRRIVMEFFLLPASGLVADQKIVVVSWTLCYEIAFYVIFGIAIFNRFLGGVIGALWLLAAIYSVGESVPAKWTILCSPYPVLFLTGMIIQRVWSSRKFDVPLVPTFVLGIVVFTAAAITRVNALGIPAGLVQWAYGVGAGLIILAAVAAERRGSLEFPEWLTRIGDASYSLYLVHFTVLSVLAKLIVATNVFKGLPLQVLFVGMAVVTVAVGMAVHLLVEKPLLKLVGRRRAPVHQAAGQLVDEVRVRNRSPQDLAREAYSTDR
ncbi:acyltransferase [Bradyrhizobium barranii]|uniref:Acyltransferase n=1 Tax=Bradyrhizobium barranii TaxID=2992140 RepID=A0ABY3QSQ1_9BRAD|nr:acyltransferase [Bradyrhizobium japonicum]UFW88718.1 acyltransferase [Bradyrhizobium japonicum]